jgi:hypothetical protein
MRCFTFEILLRVCVSAWIHVIFYLFKVIVCVDCGYFYSSIFLLLGIEILRLAEDLGLSNAAVKTSTESKHRFLYVEGQLQQMPAGLSDLLQLPSVLRGAIQGILREPFQPKGL